MTPEEQFQHDQQTAAILQQRQGQSDLALIQQGIADLMLFVWQGSKYQMPPAVAATWVELMHRCQPSTAV